MKNLKHYDEDCFKFHEQVIESKYSTKDDPLYKDRLKKLNPAIQKAFESYKSSFISNILETIIPIGYVGASKTDLQNLYSYKNAKLQELLRKVTTTSQNRKRSICANCTVSEINSFDHILPQTEFSEFVVNPLNLIPSCTNCNSRKGRFWVKGGQKLFLNFYIDAIPDIQFLKAKIEVKSIVDIEIKFILFQPKEMNDEIFKLITSHYSKLNLFKRFTDNSDDIVSEFENEIKPYLNKLPRKDIEDCIRETIEGNRAIYGTNYWKCVLKEALINDKKFMSRFIFK